MVAIVNDPEDGRKPIFYNEYKVAKKAAALIHAANFLQDKKDLALKEKFQRFEDLNNLRKGLKRYTLHISLNFAPWEKLDHPTLTAIAESYMEKIGFGAQPYLVYEHTDSGHPHIHIVTNIISQEGKRIDYHNIGKNESSEARKEVEKEFGLVRAEDHQHLVGDDILALDASKLVYGKAPTKAAISSVVKKVLARFTFSSLEELNAILSIYNVRAERGEPGSRLRLRGGLVYRVLKNGKPEGVPIKASSMYFRPILKELEKKYVPLAEKKAADKKRIRTAINWVLLNKPENLQAFIDELAKEAIQTVLYRNDKGFVYGITFVDMKSKVVFNGSDVRKEYSAAKIQAAIARENMQTAVQPAASALPREGSEETALQSTETEELGRDQSTEAEILEDLLKHEEERRRLPWELRKQRKKRRPPPR